MRVVPQRMTDIWNSGQFTGSKRPIARVTIQRTQLLTATWGAQRYASYNFGNPNNVYELPNVKSVQWTRSVETDAATATIVLYNTRELPIGVKPGPGEPYNQPGYFTFNRGDSANRWNHVNNQWTHRLYPDMLIRTYEGYGYEPSLPPESDPNQLPSGVWLIDDVELTPAGLITLKCRDAGRLLLDQISFPPVIPTGAYPQKYSKRHQVANPKVPVVTSSGGMSWINPTYHDDSGTPYNGRNGSISGHRPSDAFDGSNSTYWLSIGNSSPNAYYSYEWIEGSIPVGKVAAVRVYTKGGPYRMYVSLHDRTKGWLGRTTIPYNPNGPVSAPNGSNIRYVQSTTIAADSDVTVDVVDTPNIDRVRVTFTGLWDSNIGTYQYRAAVRDFDVLVTTATTKTTWVSGGTHTEGNYDDYTDIVKMILGYAGFFWPNDPHTAYQMHSHRNPTDPWAMQNSDKVATRPTIVQVGHDALALGGPGGMVGITAHGGVGGGAIWGDMEQSGTFGPSDLTADIFDKKPLMDGVAYIRDMLGFIFYVDEVGGAIFRSPNIWSLGNWRVQPDHRFVSPTVRTSSMITIDESKTLMGLTANLSSRNFHERVVVANVSGNLGAVTPGFLPYKLPAAGLRRVSIWSDQHFKTVQECQIMADLIALRQLFTFRTDKVTIPGYPAIQVDDQVKILEATTEETGDAHYVKGITSNLDMSTGEWKYDLDTHWLGSDAFTSWAFNPGNLSAETQQYLRDLGRVI